MMLAVIWWPVGILVLATIGLLILGLFEAPRVPRRPR
jgi:hypothetical protein